MTRRSGSPSPAHLARAVHGARSELARARRALAWGATLDAAPVYRFGPWRRLARAAASACARLHAHPEVLGVSLGPRIRGGIPVTDELAIRVYVHHKLSRRELARRKGGAVPSRIRGPDGGYHRTDVVAIGRFVRTSFPGGASVGLATRNARATLGCYATDVATGAIVGLTVMHLFASRISGAIRERDAICPSLSEGNGRPFGVLLRGTFDGVDAAAVSLRQPPSRPRHVLGVGDIQGSRPLLDPDDRFIAVRAFGARSRQVLHGRIEDVAADFPDLRLRDAILTSIAPRPGDSGAVLVDNDNIVLGILVGRFEGEITQGVFSPIQQVLSRLSCDIR